LAATVQRSDAALQHRLMHGFADLSRLRILDALRDGERRVIDLSAELGLSRPNTSKHLACLHGCALVERDKRGREVFYALADGVGEVLESIDALLERVGSSVARCEHTTQSMREEAS
jgi:ArsR family transcriptional regulator, cadmium/lead-responsive transcriptional repressor